MTFCAAARVNVGVTVAVAKWMRFGSRCVERKLVLIVFAIDKSDESKYCME